MHPNTFLKIVEQEIGLQTMDDAKKATQIVFELLHHRITPDEADDLRAQLPTELAAIWEGGTLWTDRLLAKFTPKNKFNRREFLEQVEARRKNDWSASGEKITRSVFYALQSQISPGEADDVAAQLPPDLRELWKSARPLAYYSGGGGGEAEVTPGIGGEFSKGGFGDTL